MYNKGHTPSALTAAEREQLLVDYEFAITHNVVEMRDALITRFEKVGNGKLFIEILKRELV